MSAIRTRCFLTTLAGAVLLAGALLPGCSQSPEEPVFANPFEPDVIGGQDPFDLRASYGAGRVTLTWNPLPGHGIDTYVVTWIFEGNPYELDRLEPSDGPMSYVVQDPVPNITSYYRIRALDAFERAAAVSHVVPVAVQVPPIIKLASGLTQVRSRFPDVVVRAATGDHVQLDLRDDFANALQRDIVDSVAVFPAFDLGPRPGAAARCTLYARAAFGQEGDQPPSWSATDQLVLTIQFSPTIIRPDTTVTVARPLTDLVVSNGALGVQSMRLASTAETLATAPWLPGAPLITDFALLDTPQPQTVHAEFLSEFGFTHTTTLDLQADDLTDASFRLVLPPNRVAVTPLVPIRNQARATEMRISQDPGFAGSPWLPYAREAEITIEGDPGVHQVFAWFRNHWFESPILIDHVILSGASLEVAFTHPTDGQILRGGSTVTVTGTAATFDGDYPLTLIEVHTGDGWQPANGTDQWSALWAVPRLTADTEVQIGARGTATGSDDDTHTGVTWITVLVSQLAVRITDPLAESAVPRGSTLPIAGTAAPFASGAALDSVVVAVPGSRLAASPPLANWSVDWIVPPEGELGPVPLTAWAFAAGDSVNHEVMIELVAAEDEER